MRNKTKETIHKYDLERKKALREEEKALVGFSKKKSTAENDSVKSISAVEFYEKLSPQERKDFDLQLQKSEIKQNYIKFLKYCYGENYIITKFHSFIAKICQSVVEKVEKGEKVKIMISVPPQHGKLLADDTPILTRNGWKKHGELKAGDEVINHKGKFVKITNVFPKYFANKKITFTNGEEIICHENHEWLVYDRQKHKEVVLETKEIEKTLSNIPNERKRGHRYIHQLPTKDFIKGENKELFVNPYVLGVWLGDGKNNDGTICAALKDRITIDECRKYYPNGAEWVHKTTGVIYASLNDLYKDLRKYNMCYPTSRHEKYIPQEYLTASIEQRLELLAGLIDTDGYVYHKANRVVFTTSDEKLKNTFEELVATFGWRTTTCVCKPTISTSGIVGKKEYWQIAFNPTITIPCRIERKILNHFSKQRKVSICKIETLKENVSGNCIEVEGGIYLCGKSMIPTHNSMTITETLPVWFMGRNPDLRCIITAYNADIAEKFGDKNRQLFKRVANELFGLEVSDSQDNKTLWNVKDHLGGLYSTGILGSLTSNNGSLIIVDDPFKNGKEADNKDIRDTVYDTFLDSVSTRARGNGNAIIIIHTRWHEDDLIGRLKKLDEWLYVNIPCVWEKGIDKYLGRKIGETLCPELGYDAKWAASMEQLLGPRKWNALYQGKPFADKGEYVQREWLRFYNDSSKPTSFDQITLSCDPSGGGTNKDNDPTCISIWGRNGANHYLLAKISRKMGFLEQLNEIKKLCYLYPEMKKKIIEHKANGDAIISKLNSEIGGFVPFDPKGKSKEERLSAVLPYIEAGNVYLREDDEETVQELIKFPHGEHDDFVDTLSQYLLNYEYKYAGKIKTDTYYNDISDVFRGVKV